MIGPISTTSPYTTVIKSTSATVMQSILITVQRVQSTMVPEITQITFIQPIRTTTIEINQTSGKAFQKYSYNCFI